MCKAEECKKVKMKEKLKEYNSKRNFNLTDEPKGILRAKKRARKDAEKSPDYATKQVRTGEGVAKNSGNKGKIRSKMAGGIFVVQHHFARREHFDFRLEHNGVLLSWAVPKGLSDNPDDKRLAVHVEDHPLDYANFEGVIPAGNYGAGTVEIFDKGNYAPCYDMDYGMKKGHIKVVLNGKKFKGEYSLIKIDEKNWLIKKTKEEVSTKGDPFDSLCSLRVTSSQTAPLLVCSALLHKRKPRLVCSSTFKEHCVNSLKVISRRDASTALREPMAETFAGRDVNLQGRVSVQLCVLSETVPTGKEWAFEIKYDGYRIVAFKEKNKVVCLTRNKKDFTLKLPSIVAAIKSLKFNCVLDGEVVAFDELGRSNFSLLQDKLKSNPSGLNYVVFDLLALNGRDTRNLPLSSRKEVLKNLLKNAPPALVFSEHVVGKGRQCFNFAKKNKLEGIVAKKLNSTYTGTRSESWLKIKCYKRQEFVIVGFLTTQKNPQLSAILVGFYQNNRLHYAGKVGTGFNASTRAELRKKLAKIVSDSQVDVFPQNKKINAQYVTPKYVAEIQFAEFTKEQVLRQPSFVGLRADKSAKEVKLERSKRGEK